MIAGIVVIAGLVVAIGHYLQATVLQDIEALDREMDSFDPEEETSEPVSTAGIDLTPPGVRRVKDLAPGDRLIEDDGTIVTVMSVPDTFSGDLQCWS